METPSFSAGHQNGLRSMLSRRRLLHRSLYTAAGLTLKKGVSALGQAMATPTPVRSAVKLTPYVDPLPIPPVIRSAGNFDEVIEIEMRQFQRKVHRDLPATILWGYNGTWPGPTIEAQTGHALNIQLGQQTTYDASSSHRSLNSWRGILPAGSPQRRPSPRRLCSSRRRRIPRGVVHGKW